MEGLALDSQDSRRPARGRNGVNASCIHLVDRESSATYQRTQTGAEPSNENQSCSHGEY